MQMVSHKATITRAMTVIGFLSLSLSDELNRGMLIIMGVVTLISLVVITKRKFNFPPILWNILAVVVFAIFLFIYLTQEATFVASIASLTLVLVVLKLFDLNKPKDHLLLYILVFFQLLASAVSTISPLFLLILAAFIITSIWAMTVFTIQKDYSNAGGESEKLPKGIFTLPFLTATIIMTLATFIMTLTLFFMLPRLDIGLFEKKTANTLNMTGFSETVDLGAIGELKRNSAIVMRVGIPAGTEPPRFTLYLRGAILQDYDGKSWSKGTEAPVLLRRGHPGIFTSPLKLESKLREYNIALEALDIETLFTITPWQSIELPKRFHSLWTDKYHSLRLPATPFSRINYTLRAPKDFSGVIPEVYSGNKKAEILLPYLNIEPGAGDVEEIALLAREITKDVSGDEYRARAIEYHLKNNYTYTLNPKRDETKLPLDDFLFHAKEGYCEHYATAMAIMLRTLDIPSRIVTGFLEGEWNDFGNYYIVRQQDAHSWVEVYVDDKGWTRFDPTPSAGFLAPSTTNRIALYLDSLKWRWTRSIVNFSFTDQMEGTQALAEGALTLKARLRLMLKKLQSGDLKTTTSAPLIVILVIATIIAGALILTAKKRRKEKAGKTPGFYTGLLALLKKRSLTRSLSETPMEFALRTNIREVVEVTKIYEKIRYGGRPLTAADAKDTKRLLTAIREHSKENAARAA